MAVKVNSRAYVFLAFVATILVVGGAWYYFNNGGGKSAATASAPAASKPSGGGLLSGIFGGSKADVTVCTNTWGGYGPPIHHNGGMAANKDSRFYKEQGILVAFKNIDDPSASLEAWKSGACDVQGYLTVGVWTTQLTALAEYKPKIIMKYDWSDKGDVIVGAPGINSIRDLRGKKIGLALQTPSHELILVALQSAGMTLDDVQIVSFNSAPDAATAFKAGKLDAAVVWSPDDKDCVDAIPGAKVVTSSGQFSNTIADSYIAKELVIEEKNKELAAFVKGALIANAEAKANPAKLDEIAQTLATGMNAPLDLMKNAVRVANFSNYGDNVNFFNMGGAYKGAKGEDVYTMFGAMFAKIGLAPTNLPPWRSIIDTQFIAKAALGGGIHAAESAPSFSAPTAALAAAPALATKSITVNFAFGSSELDPVNKGIIDREVATYVKMAPKLRVRIEGNTDSVGNPDVNAGLSRRRANAVADYLAVRYSMDHNKFIVVGNGPSKPVASNDTETGRAANRRTDFSLVVE